MSLLWIDDFDHYTTATISQMYDSILSNPSIVATGRNSTSGISLGNGMAIQKNIISAPTRLIVGFAFYAATYPASSGVALRNVGTTQVSVLFGTAGTCTVSAGGVARATFPYSADTWYFVEVKAYINAAVGTVEVRLNNDPTPVATYTGDTLTSAIEQIDNVYFNGSTGSSMIIDDLYICDTTGAYNNDFLGDNRVEAILPSGAGYSTQWSPSYGANYQMVDDPQASAPCPDGDTTYNYSNTPSYIDSFAYGNLRTTSGTVAGVQVSCNVKKDDAGGRSMLFFVRIGGANYYSGVQYLSDSYRYYTYCWDVNPATATPWTIADVNGAEFGYEVVS